MVDLLTIAQVGLSVFGSAGFLLVTQEGRRPQVLGVACGLMANPFWWAMVVATEQWLTVPLHLLYTWAWWSKAWRLWTSRPV